MSWSFYRHIDNWHKHPWISWLLCKMGRHDYEFMWMDGDSGVLQCFYCEHRKKSHTNLGNCKHCGSKLGKKYICYDKACRAKRTKAMLRSIREAKRRGAYEASEHISGSEIG